MTDRCTNCGAPRRTLCAPCDYCGVAVEARTAVYDDRADATTTRGLLRELMRHNEAQIVALRHRAEAAVRRARDGMEKIP